MLPKTLDTALSPWPNQDTTVPGNRIIDEAKIAGITPDKLIFNGKLERG